MRSNRVDGLDKGEGAVMDALVEAVHRFTELPTGHPNKRSSVEQYTKHNR